MSLVIERQAVKDANMTKPQLNRAAHRIVQRIKNMRAGDCGKESDVFCKVGQFLNPSYGRLPDSRSDGKLIVFGLPKSGNVWLVSMLCDYLQQPAIDPMVSIEKSGVGMCHLPFSEEIEQRKDFVQGVYLVRDLRDVIVSYFHNTKRDDWRRGVPNFHYETLEHFYFQWFLPRVAPYHSIATHGIEYAERGIPVIRYEDLYADPNAEFGRLLRRLGFPFEPTCIQHIVEARKIENMKKGGIELDVKVPPAHFRQGGWGGFQKEMPDIVLQDVERRFGEVIRRWGYEL